MEGQRVFNILILTILLSLFCNTSLLAADEQLITGIAVEGNENIEVEEILAVIKTEPGDFLNEEQIMSDLKAISALGYFQDVRASFEVYQGGLKAVFEVVENPVIQEIVIEGNESYTAETLKKLIPVEIGQVLNVNLLKESRENIEKKYQDDGYILAVFTDINVSTDGILSFTINEGYLNDIIIEGNTKTKDFVILRELGLEKGGVLNLKDIQQGYQNLLKLNLFENLDGHFERVEDEENKANLIVEVQEGKTGNANAGVTWSSKDGWLGFIRVSERNFLGNAQTLSFNWEFGGATNYSLSFYEPWLLGNPLSFGISIYDRTSSTEDELKGEYTEHRQGGSISFGQQLSEEWDGQIRLKIENSEIDWAEENYTDEGELIALTDEANSLRSITLQASRDTTNHPFFPTEGLINTISLEYAGQLLGGDAHFTKYNYELSQFYGGFRPEDTWGLRIKTGIGTGDIPELEKYRLGGSETLRGYGYGAFSGDNLLLLNAEYRFQIADNFAGVIFGDAGNVWEDIEAVNLNELHYSLGAGLRINTPIGLIRLDYGFNEEGEGQPNFSIGQTF